MSTPRDMDFDLHIPVGTKDVYLDRLKSIPEDKRTSWRFHTVRPGESLDGIASALHSHASEIASANGISLGETVAPGDELVIPVAASLNAAHPLHYTTRRGDTLVTVADRFNISTEDLRKWNHLSSNAILPGRSLAVSEPVHLAPSMRARGKASQHNRASSPSGESARTRISRGDSQHASKAKAGASSAHANKSSNSASSTRTSKTSAKSLHGSKKAAR
jgi:membrane-bound lytic murein transglycosylase D